MQNPNNMTDVQLTKWALKTATTLSNRSGSNSLNQQDITGSIVLRYNELADTLKLRCLWLDYCANCGLDVDHNASDML